MKKKREKSLSILIKVYLAVECAIRHNQVFFSNEVGLWYSTSCPDQTTQDQNLLMPFDYSISPTLATVSVIGCCFQLQSTQVSLRRGPSPTAPSPGHLHHTIWRRLWSLQSHRNQWHYLWPASHTCFQNWGSNDLNAWLKQICRTCVFQYFHSGTPHTWHCWWAAEFPFPGVERLKLARWSSPSAGRRTPHRLPWKRVTGMFYKRYYKDETRRFYLIHKVFHATPCENTFPAQSRTQPAPRQLPASLPLPRARCRPGTPRQA